MIRNDFLFSNIGIDAAGFSAPRYYMKLKDLAKERMVDPAKYKKGLMSIEMRVPEVNEDIISIGLKAGYNALLKGNISPFELQLASPQEVENMVIDRIKVGAPNGGYILSTCDMITQETPVENVYALVKAAKKFGKYPITIK